LFSFVAHELYFEADTHVILKYHHFFFHICATETTDCENNAFSLALILDFTSEYARF
jgi:hypothetical protein